MKLWWWVLGGDGRWVQVSVVVLDILRHFPLQVKPAYWSVIQQMPSLENTYQQCSTTTPPMLWWLLMTRELTLHSSLLISGGRETHQPGVVGHRWAGGLRQTQASLIPTNCKVSWICIQLIIILISSGCFPHLFLPREPGQFRERTSQVVSWSSTPLSSGSDHPGGHEAGPEGRQGDHRQVEGEEVSSYHLPSGEISDQEQNNIVES